MIQIIAFLLAIGVVVLIAMLVLNYRTLAKMQRHCDRALEQLVETLSREHLIVDHLLDVLPQGFENATQLELAEAHKRSTHALQALRPDTSNSQRARALSDAERRLQSTSIRLLQRIREDSSVCDRATIQGCVQGLSQTQERAHAAMMAYNLAVVSMTTHCELLIPAVLCRLLLHQAQHRPLIDWMPNESESGTGCDDGCEQPGSGSELA